MNKADFEYVIDQGYLSTIDEIGVWAYYDYIYKNTDADAAEGSSDSNMNGWNMFAGYGEGDAHKISQSVSTIFFLSVYDDDWNAESPVSVDDWMNSGPFKA